eukprot:235187_1
MTSWLGAIAKGAAYLYGGGGTAEDEEDINNPDTTNNTEESKYDDSIAPSQPDAQQYLPQNVYASAKGELWKFNPKREEFKVLIKHVEALVIEVDSSDFLSTFQVIRKTGQLLFQQSITNELQVQYNKSNHSMVFALYNAPRDHLEILSFIFEDEVQEEEFKMAMAIKLYENNRQESFDKLLKTKDVKEDETTWMTGAYQMDTETNVEYEETEADLQDLCEDVQMLDLESAIQNESDSDSDNDYNSEEEHEYKRNKWEEAGTKGYSDEEELAAHTDKVLPSSPFKDDVRPSKSAQNRAITGSKVFNRTYVIREMGGGASALGYFKHNDENELEYEGKITIKDRKRKNFTPSKVLQHKSDRSMLLLNDKAPGQIQVLNLDKGKIVEEWQTKETLHDIAPLTKHDEMTDNPMIYGLNKNSMFQIDARIPTKSKVIDSKQTQYKSIHNLNCISTSGNGFIATGAKDGKIRMHDVIQKRAKTCLPGLGNAIKYLEISDNGQWILATCSDYIMVIPTQVPGRAKTGFEGRGMGKMKPSPYVLRLKPSDLQKYKLRKVDFTQAHFDTGKNIDEHWIISSTGPYIIKWNFNKLKKSGIMNSYSIRKAKSKVIHNEFRFGHNDDLLVSETNSVYAQHSSKRK